MKQKIYQMLAFTMLLALIVSPVSANPTSDEVKHLVAEETQAMSEVNALPVSETGLYIIQLADPSLARYSGGISGLAATSPTVTDDNKLHVSTPASVAYLSYLQGKQGEFISQMNAALDREVQVQFQYLNTLNALAVAVSYEEALALSKLPGVAAVYADSLREIETDVGPTLIGAPAFWEGDHEQFSFFSQLSGDNEVSPNASEASGEGTYTYDPTTKELSWEISHDLDMAEVTAAHIHVGVAGVNGPVTIALDHTENPMVGSQVLTEEQIGYLMNHLLYVNVHTNTYPGGEIRDQLWTVGYRGEGVIVGMLDTGVNPVHPSFAEVDGDGYVHENPYGSENFVGVCADPMAPDYDDICNDKLIGAWNFHPSATSARDWHGHGSHTGSTIAGNRHDATFTVGADEFTRTISGVSPRANVISYLVCFPTCPNTSSVAAVDQAIADGVNVLNYSISGTDDPWNDSVDLAFLDAYAAGMFVSASAGNDGPDPGTVAKTGPWNASVAASTHSRVIANTLDVTDPTPPPELVGMAAVPGTGPAITADIEAQVIWAGDVDPGNVRGCSAFPAGSFTGAIALIQRGDCTFATKVDNATTAGAIAAIVYNHVGGPPIVMGDLAGTTIESVFIDKDDGDALADFITNSTDPVQARINEATSVIVNDAWQDLMANFSSRGPSQFDLLKPDYTAPGVNILAAGFDGPDHYYFSSGTSMSSPHGAGAAALFVQRNQDWTPAEIKSALAMTAWQDLLKEDGLTPAGFFDMGSGRIDLTQGAVFGLVMDETVANYEAANPDIGGDPKTLNQPSMVDQDCAGQCSWTRILRSVLDVEATYDVVTTAPAGMVITVAPASFTISPSATQEVEITVNVNLDILPTGVWVFAQIQLESDFASARLPITVILSEAYPVISLEPDELADTLDSGDSAVHPITISNLGMSTLEWTIEQAASPSSLTSQVLFDQTANTTSSGILAIYDLDDPATWAVQAADDFRVPANEVWTIETVFVDGFYEGLINPATEVNVFFYEDDGGLPGDEIYSAPDLMPIDVSGAFTLELPEALMLSGGHYWVSVQPKMDFFADGHWFWFMESEQTLNEFVWRNPGNGYGTGCTDWCTSSEVGFAYPDLTFQLIGTLVDQCADLQDIPWVSVFPESGMTGSGESDEVEVTFDASTLSDGIYTGNLCIFSNDPVTPVTYIPLEMTVVNSPRLQVVHLAPFAEDASVTVTLNGEPALTDFNYGDSTEYIVLPAGEYEVEVIPTGASDPAIEATILLEANTYSTAIAVGDITNQPLDLILLEDDLSEPADGMFHLRLGHLAPFAPGTATADIRMQDGSPVLLNVNFGDVTGFIELLAGEYDLKITTPGGDVTLIDPLPVDFTAGMIISAFATGEGVNQDLGVFALPAGVEGFFLPLSVEPEPEEVFIFMPVVFKN